MALRKLVMVAALAATAVAGAPAVALADGGHHGWHRGHDYDDDDDGYRDHHYRHRGAYYYEQPVYYREGYAPPPREYGCRTSGTTGLIIGGAAGALLGRQMDHSGDRATGTILGAGAGALLGREIARNHRC